jgi:hypothetical protein
MLQRTLQTMPNTMFGWCLQCYVTDLGLHVEHCAKDSMASNQLLVAWTPGAVTPHPISELKNSKLKRAYEPTTPDVVAAVEFMVIVWCETNATEIVPGDLGGLVKRCESAK